MFGWCVCLAYWVNSKKMFTSFNIHIYVYIANYTLNYLQFELTNCKVRFERNFIIVIMINRFVDI